MLMELLTSWQQALAEPVLDIHGLVTVSRLELLGFLLAVAMVACNIRVNPWAWPLAIASSLLYGALFWRERLYGEAGLQLFFVAMALWGWSQWLWGKGRGGAPLKVHALDTKGRVALAAAWLVLWTVLAQFLARATQTDVPWWDAFTTAGSVAGTWLLGRKLIENWPVWVVVNAVSVGLFAYKGLWLTVALYALFIAMALAGWRAWHRLAATRHAAP